jgi:hypothetical protein
MPSSQDNSLPASNSVSAPAPRANENTRRLILTCLWLVGLFACVFAVELYIHHGDLVDGDRLPVLRPILILYGSYLTGIFAFWYKPPFAEAGSPSLQRIRFSLALFSTVILNLVIAYMVWRNYFGSNVPVRDDVNTGAKICGFLSFLIAPANLYYFGTERRRS